MYDLTLQQILSRLVAILVVTGAHGFFLALTSRVLGDKGPQYDGRLTANPFQHLDLLGVVAAILFQTGWIRPMAIDVTKLRGGWVGAVLTVLGALLLTLALGVALSWSQVLALSLIPHARSAATAANLLATTFEVSLWFVLLNLIPVPPLAGGVVMRAWFPRAVARLASYDLVIRIVLLGLLAADIPQTVLRPAHDALAAML